MHIRLILSKNAKNKNYFKIISITKTYFTFMNQCFETQEKKIPSHQNLRPTYYPLYGRLKIFLYFF